MEKEINIDSSSLEEKKINKKCSSTLIKDKPYLVPFVKIFGYTFGIFFLAFDFFETGALTVSIQLIPKEFVGFAFILMIIALINTIILAEKIVPPEEEEKCLLEVLFRSLMIGILFGSNILITNILSTTVMN